MKKAIGMLLLAAAVLTGCTLTGKNSADKEALLYLTFDEGSGNIISDASGHLPDTEVQYQYTHAVYTENMDPQWREEGVVNGALLFDGCSTCVRYPKEALSLQGDALTISAWVAPRAFEWDDPEAAERGDEHLTAIMGQYNKKAGQGVILGYQRFGRLCLEVGTDTGWYTLWADNARLERCSWNHVAAVFDGRNGCMKLYLNGETAGELEMPAGSSIVPAEKEQLRVGENAYAEKIAAGTYNMFSGLMDEFRIEGTALAKETVEERAAAEPDEIEYESIALENILTKDCFKTQYHGGPYQHWMNEPHAPVYYNGMYHLFFQSNSVGTYWRNICWGHLVSEDTVHWRPVREAIVPTENSVVPDGVWSGCAALDKNGVPLLFFTAGNDSFKKDGLISNQNIGVAWPKDLSDPELTEWEILDHLAVAQQPGQGRPGEFRDPFIWKEDDSWYMVVCSGSAASPGGSALLYTTDRLELKPDGSLDMDWQYRGPVYEMENQSATYGTSWELPILLPLKNAEGTIEKYAFFISPAPAGLADNKVYYFVGNFDNETGKFTPDDSYGGLPRMLDYGDNVFTGPSALIDPVTGRICVFSIMQDKRSGAEEGSAGWAHCVGLTRNIRLSDDGTDVCVEPDPRLYDLFGDQLLCLENTGLQEANAALEGISGDLLYIKAVLKPEDCNSFGLTVKSNGEKDKTSFTYNTETSTICGSTANRGSASGKIRIDGALPLKDGCLTMEVFVDRSLVEGYFNADKSVCVRAYPDQDAQKIFLFADGGLSVQYLEVTAVNSIYSSGN